MNQDSFKIYFRHILTNTTIQ